MGQTAGTPSDHQLGAEVDGLVFEVVGLGSTTGHVDYREAWELQRAVHAEVVAGSRPDTVLLLEHPPVFTAGKLTEPGDRPVDGTPVVDVDRGGRITWHGPGQLVGYPIVRLPRRIDVVAHVRRLEQALIAVCADLGVTTRTVKGRTGVWLDDDAGSGVVLGAAAAPGRGPLDGPEGRRDRKIAAIGIRVARGVTMHGFALNCDPDLSWYSRIVPCGIDDADVTSLARETGHPVTVEQVLPLARRHLTEVFVGARA